MKAKNIKNARKPAKDAVKKKTVPGKTVGASVKKGSAAAKTATGVAAIKVKEEGKKISLKKAVTVRKSPAATKKTPKIALNKF